MWATLVALPGVLVAALVALQRVRPGLLRQSLQLAAILSAALHLLFLIACSLTDVFGHSPPAEQLAEKPVNNERVMLVTKRESNAIWRELNRRETSDPEAGGGARANANRGPAAAASGDCPAAAD
jgi:outer membrane biosynthesis protein TonB